MNRAVQDPKLDPEVAEVVQRFERIYASLPADGVETEAAAVSHSIFLQQDFELPPGTDDRREPTRSGECVDAVSHEGARVEPAFPQHDEPARHTPSEATAAKEMDIEDAFALLRGSEHKTRSAAPRAADPDADAEAEAEAEVTDAAQFDREPARAALRSSVASPAPKSYRRFALPALAAFLFVSVATGYVVTRDNDESAVQSPPSAVPAAPLRLDYDLQQQASSGAGDVVARRTR